MRLGCIYGHNISGGYVAVSGIGLQQQRRAGKLWAAGIGIGRVETRWSRKGWKKCDGFCIAATQQQEAARKLQDSDSFPIVRSYKNELCSLELMGDAAAGEALAALASDGGRTAEEELGRGKSLMTVDITVRGSVGERSTVSTRILAPTKLVAERALEDERKARAGGLRECELVVMRRGMRFELQVLQPGHVRDMGRVQEEEEKTGEAAVRVVSLDVKMLDWIAMAVASHALACTKKLWREESEEWKGWRRFVGGIRWNPNRNAPVRVRLLSAREMADEVRKRWGELPGPEQRGTWARTREWHGWWPMTSVMPSSLMPPEDAWVLEYVPAHMLQITMERAEVEVEGGRSVKKEGPGWWTVLLTHAQMVELANVLDCYYDDPFTVPGKKLSSEGELLVPLGSRGGVIRAATMSGAAMLVGVAVLIGVLVASRLRSGKLQSSSVLPAAVTSVLRPLSMAARNRKPLLPINDQLPGKEMEVLCRVVVAMVKDGIGWTEEIVSKAEEGAWMGLDLTKWERPREATTNEPKGSADMTSSFEIVDEVKPEDEVSSSAVLSDAARVVGSEVGSSPGTGPADVGDIAFPAENVLVYQVVLARDGQVIGFSPVNTAAIQCWSQFPLANALYDGKKLKPGLLERVPKYAGSPDDAVVIELLYLDDKAATSVTARPFQL